MRSAFRRWKGVAMIHIFWLRLFKIKSATEIKQERWALSPWRFLGRTSSFFPFSLRDCDRSETRALFIDILTDHDGYDPCSMQMARRKPINKEKKRVENNKKERRKWELKRNPNYSNWKRIKEFAIPKRRGRRCRLQTSSQLLLLFRLYFVCCLSSNVAKGESERPVGSHVRSVGPFNKDKKSHGLFFFSFFCSFQVESSSLPRYPQKMLKAFRHRV